MPTILRIPVQVVTHDQWHIPVLCDPHGKKVDAGMRNQNEAPHCDGMKDGCTEGLSVQSLLRKGNFGIGGFPATRDCLLMLGGRAYRIRDCGGAADAALDSAVEWAAVLQFVPDYTTVTSSILSIRDLSAHCNSLRTSDRCCYAYWVEGLFAQVLLGSWSATPSSLVWAPREKPAAYEMENIRGSLLGFWSPQLAAESGRRSFVFYFLSESGQQGGVLQDIACGPARLRLQRFSSFRQ